MRILHGAALIALLTVGQNVRPTPSDIAGPWESGQGIGLFIETNGRSNWMRDLHIRVQLDAAWGWYGMRGNGGSAEFDGEHLKVAGLDVRLRRNPPRWAGR